MAEKFLHNELIAMAIWDSPNKVLTIRGLVKSMRRMFPRFRSWKKGKMFIVLTHVLLTDDVFVTIGYKPPRPWNYLWSIREQVITKYFSGGPLQWRKLISEWKLNKREMSWDDYLDEKRNKLISYRGFKSKQVISYIRQKGLFWQLMA